MTKQALIELRDNAAMRGLAMYSFATEAGFDHETAQSICNAQEGSLDAAVVFLEAVLPEWHYGISSISPTDNGKCFCGVSENPFVSKEIYEAEAATPARALLLATLEALIAREE